MMQMWTVQAGWDVRLCVPGLWDRVSHTILFLYKGFFVGGYIMTSTRRNVEENSRRSEKLSFARTSQGSWRRACWDFGNRSKKSSGFFQAVREQSAGWKLNSEGSQECKTSLAKVANQQVPHRDSTDSLDWRFPKLTPPKYWNVKEDVRVWAFTLILLSRSSWVCF